jgi:alkanesulfonate monooxygenase SsuD/methylene tetrahydromethanopterin reductase-like flavin-dependent oxidoreductase (luciferase family)
VKKECDTFRSIFAEAIGTNPPAPIVAGWTYVDSNADRAEERARLWIGRYWNSVVEHYEFDQPHLKDTPGYEFHVKLYEGLMAPGGKEKYTDEYVALQTWGTPEQVHEKVTSVARLTGADTFIPVFRYAGMPSDEAEANMRLFATEVMPGLKQHSAAAAVPAT